MAEGFKPGDKFYQWEIVSELGSGLHGTVYLVKHLQLDELFALKMMHLEDAKIASKIRRSLATAKANYRVQCENVVKVLHLGCEPDGRVWTIMELLQGQTIHRLMAGQKGRLSLWMALYVAIETAWGVDAAHELGIIHRDLKPENVWLTTERIVKVLDFSLAKVVPEGLVTSRKTGMGTVAYMAPEGLKSDAEVDARADVYSLAVMLWQMIVGRHPFEHVLRNTTELVKHHLYVEPPLVSAMMGLPAYVDDFFRRALAKDPNGRFQTIAEMAQAMIALRDRLREDEAKGVFYVDVPEGEPPVPNDDPKKRRAYEPRVPLPEHATPREVPAARVVVAGGMPAVVKPEVGLVGTLPLEGRGALLPRAAAIAPQPPTLAAPTSALPLRETPPAIERPVELTHPSRARLVIAVLVLAAAVVASVATWRSGQARRTAERQRTQPTSIPVQPGTAIPSAVPPVPAPTSAEPTARTSTPSPSATAERLLPAPTASASASAAPQAVAAPRPERARRAPPAPAPTVTARPSAPAPAPTATSRVFDVE